MSFRGLVKQAIEKASALENQAPMKQLRADFPAEFLRSTEARREAIAPTRSKYAVPHQGAKEKARRVKRAAATPVQ